MKHSGVLHAELSKIIAELGHQQTLIIADYGLPAPKGVPVIDLALRKGIPSFIDVLEIVLEELHVESALVAKELTNNQEMLQRIQGMFPFQLEMCEHTQLKLETEQAVAMVRTGEHSPFANIILRSGVVF